MSQTTTPAAGDATSVILSKIAELKQTQDAQAKTLESIQTSKNKARSGGFLAPFAREGEDSLSSRGYSFVKMAAVANGILPKEQAKLEIEVSNKLSELMQGSGYNKSAANSILAPVASSHLINLGDDSIARDIREVVKAGVSGYDPDEVRQIRKTLSWQDITQGGALVGPPLMGELIDILRNNECLMTAGCRTLPMPPNGRLVFPRQTAAATAYWVGEAQTITSSQPNTGDVVLQARKMGILLKVPNELFRFASVAVEQFLREDMARVAALRLDKSLLEGTGVGLEPKGLISYTNINSYTAGTTGTNGDTFQPEDCIKMVGTVEEANAVFKSWIMRPLMFAALANRRADAVTGGDAKGMFLFDVLRELGEDQNVERGTSGALVGYPVIKSTQVSQARVKGSGTNLTYILGGDFTDYVMALSGVMEFLVSTVGDTPFQQDQTWIRALMFADGAPRHEASFVICDDLLVA